MKSNYDVAIIGGGASGLAAAIELKTLRPELNVVIIEKNDSLGRKIRATGNGRCNITNKNANGYIEIMKWLLKIGIMTRSCDSDLVYPYSESAADVVDLLTARVGSELPKMTIWGHTSVTSIKGKGPFEISICKGNGEKSDTVQADKVIIATGGKAGPQYGTTGDGYAFARSFGHTIVTPIPVLAGIECENWDKSLAGIRAKGVVSLFNNGDKIFEETGEIQFTKTGLSGICIFNMTRFMRYNRAEGETLDQFQVKLNLFPEGNIRELAEISGRQDVLRTVLRRELAEYVMQQGIDSIHELTFIPSAVKGWKDAQVTSGGVDLGEIYPDTCESRLVPGIYITGELLDYDGPCGGYNLSNAWLTGLKAARHISEVAK